MPVSTEAAPLTIHQYPCPQLTHIAQPYLPQHPTISCQATASWPAPLQGSTLLAKASRAPHRLPGSPHRAVYFCSRDPRSRSPTAPSVEKFSFGFSASVFTFESILSCSSPCRSLCGQPWQGDKEASEGPGLLSKEREERWVRGWWCPPAHRSAGCVMTQGERSQRCRHETRSSYRACV